MNVWRLLLLAAVLLGLVTSVVAEVVYSGVKSMGFPVPPHGELPLDLDGDGAADLGLTYVVMQTMDIPPSVVSGQVYLRAKGAHRVLVNGRDAAALPQGYAIQAQPSNGFIWAGVADRPYGLSVGHWGQTRTTPWTGWQGFAATQDPVFGVELHSAAGTRFGWVRLRFSGGMPFVGGAVYDWAYETTPGQPIGARVGSNGTVTPAPPIPESATVFVARLAGSKAVPPNSNPLTVAARMTLSGGTLLVNLSLSSDGANAASVFVQGRGGEQTIPLSASGLVIHATGSTDGTATVLGSTILVGSASISPTLADAIRDGEAHLLLPLAGGALRGQIARPLPEPPAAEPQPLAGSYTLLLRPPEASTEPEAKPAPAGVGHGQVHLSADGSAALDVILPLGVPLRWRGMLAADDTLSIDAPIRKAQGGGSVTGTLKVTSTGARSLVNGTLNWRRPPLAKAARYPRGFEIALNVEGERHRTARLRSGSYLLSLVGGSLREPITVPVIAADTQTLSATEGAVDGVAGTSLQIAGANSHHVTIYLDPVTGVFRGTFRYPRTRSRVPFAGRMLTGAHHGAGAFTFFGKSGAVSINPIAQLPARPLSGVATHTLTPSPTDADVVMLSASGIVPDTSYDLELVARPVSVVPADGIYDFDIVKRKVSDIGLQVLTSRTATIALLRNSSFMGVRVHGGFILEGNISYELQ
jgi:hypothetical protein